MVREPGGKCAGEGGGLCYMVGVSAQQRGVQMVEGIQFLPTTPPLVLILRVLQALFACIRREKLVASAASLYSKSV